MFNYYTITGHEAGQGGDPVTVCIHAPDSVTAEKAAKVNIARQVDADSPDDIHVDTIVQTREVPVTIFTPHGELDPPIPIPSDVELNHAVEFEHADMVRNLMKSPDVLHEESEPAKWALLHAILGIAGELSEMDAFDSVENMLEECGDLLFYLRNLRQVLSLGNYEYQPLDESVRAFQLAGDLLDYAKRITIYNYPRHHPKLKDIQTLTDVTESFVVNVLNSHGFTRADALRHNIDKLLVGENARFRQGYSDTAAQQRVDKGGE